MSPMVWADGRCGVKWADSQQSRTGWSTTPSSHPHPREAQSTVSLLFVTPSVLSQAHVSSDIQTRYITNDTAVQVWGSFWVIRQVNSILFSSTGSVWLIRHRCLGRKGSGVLITHVWALDVIMWQAGHVTPSKLQEARSLSHNRKLPTLFGRAILKPVE